MNKIIILICIFFICSCSSAPRERKPFMIVGKVASPKSLYTVLNFGGSVGSSDYDKKTVMGTRFHSFTSVNLYPDLFIIWNTPLVSFAVGDRYTFGWSDHTTTNDEGESLEVESFRTEMHAPYLQLSKLLFCSRFGGCIVASGNYIPFLKINYSNFGSLNRIYKQSDKGNGIEGALQIFTRGVAATIKYQKLKFDRSFQSESIFIGVDYYITLF